MSYDRDNELAFAYVGSVLPDLPRFVTSAFSRAGVMSQSNLLRGLLEAGLRPSIVLSYRQIAAFPRGRPVLERSETTDLFEGVSLRLLPFLNITPLKQICLGVLTFGHLMRWSSSLPDDRPRIIYVFNLTVPPGVFVWLAARLTGATAIVALYDINEPGQTVPDTLLNRLDFAMQKWLIPRFDGHVVVSDAIARDFLPGRKYLRVEGGVTQEMLAAGSVRPNDEGARPFTMVLAGTLNEANGVRLALGAMERLGNANIRLLIAGRGPLDPEIAARAAHDFRIAHLGFLSLADVLALYRRADLLLNLRLTHELRTRYFFPSKVMEFLASGTPLLTTCPGHTRDELRDLAYLLEEESREALANKIEELLAIAPQTRLARAERARAYVRDQKSWNAQGRKVANFIRELVAAKSR